MYAYIAIVQPRIWVLTNFRFPNIDDLGIITPWDQSCFPDLPRGRVSSGSEARMQETVQGNYLIVTPEHCFYALSVYE